jgi:hypothetical protein
MAIQYKHLSDEQIEHFMNYGYCLVPSAFTQEQAKEVAGNVWERLGFDPNDRDTWVQDEINMPGQEKMNMPTLRRWNTSKFAPKAWGAICELLGGEERIDPKSRFWGDGLIINLGNKHWEGRDYSPKDLDNWHVDGR